MAIAVTASPTHTAVFSCGVMLAQPERNRIAVKLIILFIALSSSTQDGSVRALSNVGAFSGLVCFRGCYMKNWIKENGGLIGVLIFLLVVVWWGTSEADTLAEIGPSQVGSTFSSGTMLTLTERRDKFDFTLGYITKQKFSVCDRPDCTWRVDEQIFFGAERVFRSPWTDRLNVSLGPYYFSRPDRIGTSRFRIGLGLEYRVNDHFGLRLRHFSLAGTGEELTICREPWGCLTNDWNTGQDSWLRLVYYF